MNILTYLLIKLSNSKGHGGGHNQGFGGGHNQGGGETNSFYLNQYIFYIRFN